MWLVGNGRIGVMSDSRKIGVLEALELQLQTLCTWIRIQLRFKGSPSVVDVDPMPVAFFYLATLHGDRLDGEMQKMFKIYFHIMSELRAAPGSFSDDHGVCKGGTSSRQAIIPFSLRPEILVNSVDLHQVL
jgi:hypothetical protein